MDYIRGDALRHRLALQCKDIHDLDLDSNPKLATLSQTDREIRETRLFRETLAGEYRDGIREIIVALNECGVAPLDIKLGNVIEGASGRLYWIDFERAHLASYMNWSAALNDQNKLLNSSFGVRLVAQRDVDGCAPLAEACAPVDFGRCLSNGRLNKKGQRISNKLRSGD
jgi:hypothetical protein